MTADEEKRFSEMCARLGIDPVAVAELRSFIENACEAASERGEIMGASPFDGSWPKEA